MAFAKKELPSTPAELFGKIENMINISQDIYFEGGLTYFALFLIVYLFAKFFLNRDPITQDSVLLKITSSGVALVAAYLTCTSTFKLFPVVDADSLVGYACTSVAITIIFAFAKWAFNNRQYLFSLIASHNKNRPFE